MECYKITRKLNNQYLSYYLQNCRWTLTYRIEQKTIPKFDGSKIFVFKSYRDALDYLKDDYPDRDEDFCIFRCECPNLEHFPYFLGGRSKEMMEKFWIHKCGRYMNNSEMTYVTDWVIPKELVYGDPL